MLPDRLVTMANQIARFFASQGADQAASGVADHLRKFWDPRMRIALIGICQDDPAASGLDPLVIRAVEQLQHQNT
jgi:formate dehydrogenase subunit delta